MSKEPNSSGIERPLLLSKSIPPIPREGLIARPRLLSMLDREDIRVTAVVAPAGWGKSTLLAQWARMVAERQVVGWLTLDRTDDDPVRFWEHLITSLRRQGSAVGKSALAALRVPGLDPLEVAVPRLINDLVESGDAHVMILDDFHLLRDRRIGEAVEYCATYLPAHARMVIGSRLDPPLPLALWRVRGLLTEIRAADLRFHESEALQLMSRVASTELDSDRIRQLVERTEGWAAGLQLTAMALRGTDDWTSDLGTVGRDRLHLDDYVMSEAITSLNEEQRDFILRTSVLERLSPSLCDAALGIEGSEAILTQLDAVDPFLSRLEGDGRWFQYHALIRDVLRRESVLRGAGHHGRVLRRAAGWFLAHGDAEQAIRLLVDADDSARAVELLLRHEDEFLDRGEIGTFLALANSLDADVVQANPRLEVAMAWADGSGGSGDRVIELLDRAESTMTDEEEPPTGWATLAGSAAALRAIYGHDATGEAGFRHARRAVELEQDRTRPGYAVAQMALGLAFAGRGQFEQAIPHLKEAWVTSDVPGMPVFARLPIAGLLAGSLVSAGRVDEAHRLLATATPIAHRLEVSLGDAAGPATGALRFAEGQVELAEGDIDRARQKLVRAVALVRIAGNPSLLVRTLTVLAQAELAAGNKQAARRALEEARDVIDSEPVFPATLAALEDMEMRLGRAAADSARTERRLLEDLTDRELSILRSLPGPLTQREIGRELYLSINTVKGYTKSLYRKLGVTSRAGAVEQARKLGLL